MPGRSISRRNFLLLSVVATFTAACLVVVLITFSAYHTRLREATAIARLKARGEYLELSHYSPWYAFGIQALTERLSFEGAYEVEIKAVTYDESIRDEIGALTTLEILGLGDVHSDNPDLHIHVSPTVKLIGLANCAFPTTVLQDLFSRRHLQSLHIGDMNLSSNELSAILNNRSITNLLLYSSSLPKSLIHKVKHASRITRLTLENITDASGVPDLILSLRELKNVSLREMKLTDHVINALKSLPNLDRVDVRKVTVTSEMFNKHRSFLSSRLFADDPTVIEE